MREWQTEVELEIDAAHNGVDQDRAPLNLFIYINDHEDFAWQS